MPDQCSPARQLMLLTGVAVEKLSTPKFTKIKLRQEALQSISSGRLDVFYPPNSASFRGKGSFSTPTPDITHQPRVKIVFSVLTCTIARGPSHAARAFAEDRHAVTSRR